MKGIITSSQGFQNQFQFFRSSGNYETIGVDFLINKKFDHITTWLSYSNAENTYEFNQLTPPSFPSNLDIRHRINFGLSYRANNLELSSGLNWHSGRPITDPVKLNEIVNNNINYDTANNARLNDYLRVDISATYRFPMGGKVRALAGISMWNILNRENIVNRYSTINNQNQVEAIEQASLGLTPNIIFRVSF